jgi:hypothetical protein
VQALRFEAQATATHTNKTAKLLDSVVRGDEAMNTVAA